MADLFQPPNADYLKGQFLRDLRLAAIDAGLAEPPTTPKSDWDLLGSAVANMALLGFANVNALEDDASVLTSTGDELDAIRRAEGLPEVPAAGATGKIIITVAGSTTIVDGQTFLYPSGLTGEVVGTYVDPADQLEINVRAVDKGKNTNLRSGEIVRFRNPPVNLETEAKVSFGEPLTGGTEAESDDRKRDRILNVRRNKPAGGNWAHIRQVALDALGTVQDCYVYPTLGGPGSAKVVPVKDFDVDTGDFSRTIASTALDVIRGAIQAELPSPNEIVVQAVVNQPSDVSVYIEIPESTLSGGNGRGWLDQQVWPILESGDANRVTIAAASAGNDQITVTAATTVAPIDGQTHIAWWSQVDRAFMTALVTLHSGGTGAWVLTLDRPLVGKTGGGPVVGSTGDLISPAAAGLERYGAAWVELFRALGPGENIAANDARVPRALRHPFVTDEDPSALKNVPLYKFTQKFPEITDIAYGYRPLTAPTVPGAVATAPNILIPRRLAFYKL